jgi:NTE family protein
VSGGSIAAGYLACIWSKLGKPNVSGTFDQFRKVYVEPILAFSRQKIDVTDILTGMLLWHRASDQVAASYEHLLFGSTTLQDIPAPQLPG